MQLLDTQTKALMEMEQQLVVVNSKGKTKKRLTMHKLPLTCICIDSKNQHAFTASKDGSIIKWCLKVRKMLGRIDSISKKRADSDKSLVEKHHVRHINAMAISSDDKFLATGGWDKHVRLWSPSDLTWLHTFSLHRQEITALAFRQGHPTLYSGSGDRSVMIWSLEDDDNRCFVEALYGHESPITSMDASRKERILSTGGLDQSIRVWKIIEQAQTVFQSEHKSVDVARLIDDSTFVTGGEDGSISVWTTMKRKPLLTVQNAHKADGGDLLRESGNILFPSILGLWITALATFPLKKKVNRNDNARKKQKLDVEQETEIYNYDYVEGEEDIRDNEESTELTNDAEGAVALVASGSCDSKLRLWTLSKIEGKYELNLSEAYDCPGFINDLRFTSDGAQIVAACGQEHRLGRWWRLGTAKNCMRIFDVKIKH